MEVCNIVNGQQAYRRLTDQQTADMIRYTAVKPEERFRKIQEIVSLNFFLCLVFRSYCWPITLQAWKSKSKITVSENNCLIQENMLYCSFLFV